ncbi:arogenate dehydrogenase 1, chloroplastic [Rhodamnia argentea]|uniref:Arogenate dehydrogenase 1, chloroplastic n=1 Tax=Rhodamnia argentea TaxID=178133 RepID=A0ABM3HA88_9MYRT|nr:arogenate dehydrogenase 1, chloroplastic [Rhodamnia argentea]
MPFAFNSLQRLRGPPPSVPHLHNTLSPLPHFQSLRPSLRSPQPLSRRPRRRRRHLRIQSIDAAQLYDYESKLSASFESHRKLTIAIVGFGNFGQFLAKTLTRQGHTVLAHSRSDHSDVARKLGVTFFRDPDDLCEEHPEVILFCTSILSTEKVVKSLPLQRLKRNTLVVDVLSVKEFAKTLLIKLLPCDFDIICTHPMFGPESGKNGWSGLNFVYEKVRIGDEESRISRADKFLDIFAGEGCNMVEMTCAEHDKWAAGSQFITHTVGRVLEKLDLESTPINTKGYETLLGLVDNTAGDSFDLYYGLFMYNNNSLEMLERLDLAFEALKKQLFGRLHDVVRKQLFESAEKVPVSPENYGMLSNITNGAASSKSMGFQDVAPSISSPVPSSSTSQDTSPLKIAIVGFGNFGQFLAKTMVRQGHTVIAYSRSNNCEAAQRLGVSFFSNVDDLCEEHPDVILLCSSILSTESVLKSLALQRLKRSTLFVDVLSVKEFPRVLFLQNLPLDFDVLCTHPMFGPESGKNGWSGLSFVYDKVRVGSDEFRQARCDWFLDIFAQEGCLMVEMSCAEHDWHAAGSQFITHTMGRTLEKLGLESTPINTKGYETLLNLVENTAGDSFDLYYGLFMYNVNAMEQLERLDLAFESLKKQLFGRMHGVLRKQLFENADKSKVLHEKPVLPKPSQDVGALSFGSKFKTFEV